MKLKKADEPYRVYAPYLFEDEAESDGHKITVDGADSDGGVYLHLGFVRYVPQVIRDHRQERGYPLADRVYEWSGRGANLTRAQALKLARQLIKAAAYEESDGE